MKIVPPLWEVSHLAAAKNVALQTWMKKFDHKNTHMNQKKHGRILSSEMMYFPNTSKYQYFGGVSLDPTTKKSRNTDHHHLFCPGILRILGFPIVPHLGTIGKHMKAPPFLAPPNRLEILVGLKMGILMSL